MLRSASVIRLPGVSCLLDAGLMFWLTQFLVFRIAEIGRIHSCGMDYRRPGRNFDIASESWLNPIFHCHYGCWNPKR